MTAGTNFKIPWKALLNPVMNLQELAELLRNEDEITVLELLEIHSDELVDAFLDKVEEKQQEVYRHFVE